MAAAATVMVSRIMLWTFFHRQHACCSPRRRYAWPKANLSLAIATTSQLFFNDSYYFCTSFRIGCLQIYWNLQNKFHVSSPTTFDKCLDCLFSWDWKVNWVNFEFLFSIFMKEDEVFCLMYFVWMWQCLWISNKLAWIDTELIYGKGVDYVLKGELRQ